MNRLITTIFQVMLFASLVIVFWMSKRYDKEKNE